jgi:hypothetical protein
MVGRQMGVGKTFREILLAALQTHFNQHGEKVLDRAVIKAALADSLPAISSDLVEALHADANRMLAERADTEHHVAAEVRKHYGEALELTEMVLRIAHAMGEEVVEEHLQPPKSPVVVWVVAHLHARACRIAEEALLLVKAGYGLGAYSRWRSLHEVVIVSAFISQHGQEVALRYIEHMSVGDFRALRDYAEHAEKAGYEPLPDGRLEEAQAAYDALRTRYGKAFVQDYGWAADIFRTELNREPSFRALETAVGFEHLRVSYGEANKGVHADPLGVLDPRDRGPHRGAVLSGPSLHGLATPGHALPIALTNSTGTLLTTANNWGAPLVISVMLLLTAQAGDAFAAGAARLAELN